MSKIKVNEIEKASGSGITIPTGSSFTITDGLAVSSLPTVTVAKGGTNITSFTAGDLLYATGSTTLAKLAKGTAAQKLAMNAGATAPEWVTTSGGGQFQFVTRTAVSSNVASVAFNNLGACYAFQGQVDLAIHNFKKSINLETSYFDAIYRLG